MKRDRYIISSDDSYFKVGKSFLYFKTTLPETGVRMKEAIRTIINIRIISTFSLLSNLEDLILVFA